MDTRYIPGQQVIEPILGPLCKALNACDLPTVVLGERAVLIDKRLCMVFTPLEGGLQVRLEGTETKWFDLFYGAMGGVAALALDSLRRREKRGAGEWVGALALGHHIPQAIQSLWLEMQVWRSLDRAVELQTLATCHYCGASQRTHGFECPSCGAPRDGRARLAARCA